MTGVFGTVVGRVLEARTVNQWFAERGMRALVFVTCALLSLIGCAATVQAQIAAKAATGKALNVSIFVDSGSGDACYGTGRWEAINKLVQLSQDDVNAQGGIHGRRDEAQFLHGAGQLNAFS